MQDDLVWHRDEEDRTIIVAEGLGWQFQRDNCLPELIREGDRIHVNAGEYHRLIKGDSDLIVTIIKEKKKLSKKQMKIAGAAPPPDEITADDFKKLRSSNEYDLDEKASDNRQYAANRSDDDKDCLDRTTKAFRDAKKTKTKKDDDAAIKARKACPEGKTVKVDADILREYLEELVEEQKLYKALDEVASIEEEENWLYEFSETEELDSLDEKRKKRRKKRKKRKKRKSSKSGRTLSKAVKKSLDKKADRRCLTRGSVYAEFRAGLGAYYSSGSRKGMSPHQWAHARVNSANPSKSWAKVKKRKKCPKKKKKK